MRVAYEQDINAFITQLCAATSKNVEAQKDVIRYGIALKRLYLNQLGFLLSELALTYQLWMYYQSFNEALSFKNNHLVEVTLLQLSFISHKFLSDQPLYVERFFQVLKGDDHSDCYSAKGGLDEFLENEVDVFLKVYPYIAECDFSPEYTATLFSLEKSHLIRNAISLFANKADSDAMSSDTVCTYQQRTFNWLCQDIDNSIPGYANKWSHAGLQALSTKELITLYLSLDPVLSSEFYCTVQHSFLLAQSCRGQIVHDYAKSLRAHVKQRLCYLTDTWNNFIGHLKANNYQEILRGMPHADLVAMTHSLGTNSVTQLLEYQSFLNIKILSAYFMGQVESNCKIVLERINIHSMLDVGAMLSMFKAEKWGFVISILKPRIKQLIFTEFELASMVTGIFMPEYSISFYLQIARDEKRIYLNSVPSPNNIYALMASLMASIDPELVKMMLRSSHGIFKSIEKTPLMAKLPLVISLIDQGLINDIHQLVGALAAVEQKSWRDIFDALGLAKLDLVLKQYRALSLVKVIEILMLHNEAIFSWDNLDQTMAWLSIALRKVGWLKLIPDAHSLSVILKQIPDKYQSSIIIALDDDFLRSIIPDVKSLMHFKSPQLLQDFIFPKLGEKHLYALIKCFEHLILLIAILRHQESRQFFILNYGIKKTVGHIRNILEFCYLISYLSDSSGLSKLKFIQSMSYAELSNLINDLEDLNVLLAQLNDDAKDFVMDFLDHKISQMLFPVNSLNDRTIQKFAPLEKYTLIYKQGKYNQKYNKVNIDSSAEDIRLLFAEANSWFFLSSYFQDSTQKVKASIMAKCMESPTPVEMIDFMKEKIRQLDEQGALSASGLYYYATFNNVEVGTKIIHVIKCLQQSIKATPLAQTSNQRTTNLSIQLSA